LSRPHNTLTKPHGKMVATQHDWVAKLARTESPWVPHFCPGLGGSGSLDFS
jgi:hypothetical protein